MSATDGWVRRSRASLSSTSPTATAIPAISSVSVQAARETTRCTSGAGRAAECPVPDVALTAFSSMGAPSFAVLGFCIVERVLGRALGLRSRGSGVFVFSCARVAASEGGGVVRSNPESGICTLLASAGAMSAGRAVDFPRGESAAASVFFEGVPSIRFIDEKRPGVDMVGAPPGEAVQNSKLRVI